jgi:DNA repair exonuclease SbcCD ATPase subunit
MGTTAEYGASEVFPDLHLKMSKKIAQLTKVIYHLNTRNDDHHQDITALNKTHENEIEEILKDASNKLNRFKQQLDDKKKQGDVAKKLDVLKEQHQKEKTDALAEFAAYKKKVKERELKLQCEFENRLEVVNGQVEDVRNNFEQRIKQFAEATASLEKKSMDKGELDKLRKEHVKEIANHVRDHNTKFNEMLMEQMNVQEAMKAKHDVDMETQKASMQDQHANELQALRSQLVKEHTAEMEGAQKKWMTESADTLKECKEDYEAKIKAMLADLQSSKAECKRLESEAAQSGSSSAELSKEMGQVVFIAVLPLNMCLCLYAACASEITCACLCVCVAVCIQCACTCLPKLCLNQLVFYIILVPA